MPSVELSAGTIDYDDTGGDRPVVVLVPGLLMDATLWREVVADLAVDHRCIVPTLPLGAHRHPMRADADLSMRGQARLLAELLERLELGEVTLVGNDWGGFQLTAVDRPDLVARLGLVSCEAFDNVPPGLPGRTVGLAARLPGGLRMAVLTLRPSVMRRLPFTFGWMAKRPIPADVARSWLAASRHDRRVLRDLRRYIRTTRYDELLEAAERLRDFRGPALVAWAAEDRVMPPEHGRRLAELMPRATLVEIDDSYTLVPLDRPRPLAQAIRALVREPAAEPSR